MIAATARKEDINGWYEIKDNPLSKAGVYQYLGSSIDADGSMGLEPDKIYNVYRPAEELSSKECIDSFKLLPWINDHEMLGEGLTPAETKGVEGVIGSDVYYDSDSNTLKGNIKLFSKSLKTSIDAGKQELSCGYRCKYERKVGIYDGERYDVVQKSLRGNHLALVDDGRMGPEVSVLDASDRFSFTIDNREFFMEPEKNENAESGVAAKDMSLAEVTATLKEIMPQISQLMEAMNSMGNKEVELDEEVEEVEDEKEDEEKAEDASSMDSLEKENKELKAKVEKLSTSMDSFEKNGMKSLLSQIAKRDSLADGLSEHIGTFDHAEMNIDEVAKYGVKKLSLACDSGEEIAAIKGFLHNRKKSTQSHGMDSAQKSSAISSYLSGER